MTVRLSVNLARDVSQELKRICQNSGVSVTEGVRRCIALWKLLSEETRKGNRVLIQEGEGESARYRELILL
jgi:hypothetical protein